MTTIHRGALRGVQFTWAGKKRFKAFREEKNHAGYAVEFRREYGNPHDENAIAVLVDGEHFGYVARELACRLAPKLDAGAKMRGTLEMLYALQARTNGAFRFTLTSPKPFKSLKAKKAEKGWLKARRSKLPRPNRE